MQEQGVNPRRRPAAEPSPKTAWSKVVGVLRWLCPADCRCELLLNEAAGLLEGRAADLYIERGRPVPYWAWLNALAHRSISEVEALALELPGEEWSDATIEIAAALMRLGPAEAALIRKELFLPAELEAFIHKEGSPQALVRAVKRRLTAEAHRRERPIS